MPTPKVLGRVRDADGNIVLLYDAVAISKLSFDDMKDFVVRHEGFAVRSVSVFEDERENIFSVVEHLERNLSRALTDMERAQLRLEAAYNRYGAFSILVNTTPGYHEDDYPFIVDPDES